MAILFVVVFLVCLGYGYLSSEMDKINAKAAARDALAEAEAERNAQA